MKKKFATYIQYLSNEHKRSVLFGGWKLELNLACDYLKRKHRPYDPVKPRMIQIEPTRKCNLSCTMCIRKGGSFDASMTFDFFKELISRDFTYPHFLLLYGQGEPFLAEDLFRMIRYERSLGNYVTTVTNGTMIDDGICREIVQSDLNMLRVSIDGATERTYNSIRKGADYNSVIGNVGKLVRYINEKKARTKIALTFMALKENYRDMVEMVLMTSDLGIEYLEIKDLPPYADSPLKPLSVEIREDANVKEDLEVSIKKMKREARRRKVKIIMSKFHCVFNNEGCMNPWFKTFISWDGKVKICSKLFAPSSPVMGDLNKISFEEIWNGPLYNSARIKIKEGVIPFEECRTVL